jgi:hypothetical protein
MSAIKRKIARKFAIENRGSWQCLRRETPLIGQPKWEARLAIVECMAAPRNAREASRPQTAQIGTR